MDAAVLHSHYDLLIARARELEPISTAVAHPCDESSLRGAIEAADEGLIRPILVGPADRIAAVAKKAQLDLTRFETIDAPHSAASAAKAVELVRQGKASLVMKGSLHSDELLGACMHKETGLRTGRRVSHVFIMDVPTYAEPLFITDAAVNIFPDLESKRDIIQNAIDLHVGLGLGSPRVAILRRTRTRPPPSNNLARFAGLHWHRRRMRAN